MSNNWWTGRGMIKTISDHIVNDSFTGREFVVTDIVVSVKRRVKDVDKFTMVPLECWGDVSEKCKDLKSGDIVNVEGRFENKKWTNKENKEMSKNVIVVESISKV